MSASSSSPRRRFSLEFKQQALARLNDCASVSALARELGIRRKSLYQWKQQAAAGTLGTSRLGRPPRALPTPPTSGSAPPLPPLSPPPDRALIRRVAELERLTAQQALELDFFRRAWQRVAAPRQASNERGATNSTPRSASTPAALSPPSTEGESR